MLDRSGEDTAVVLPSPTEAGREPDLGFVGEGTHDLLRQIRDAVLAGTAREEPAPTIIDLTGGAVSKSHMRLRLRWLVISGGTAGHTLQLKSGAAARISVIVGNNPVSLPVYLVVERGVDLAVVDSDGVSVNFAAYIVAYPE